MIYLNEEKIKRIKLGKNNMYVVIDFDKTITDARSNDSWSVIWKMLTKEAKIQLESLYSIYRPIELDYTIPFNEKQIMIEKWYKEVIDIYYEDNLTIEKLKKSVKMGKLIYREGAKEFLEFMYNNNIPVIILSAGIGNVIEEFLRNTNCYYSNIHVISNFIKFDEQGKIRRFSSKMIHSLNKTMEGYIEEDLEKELSKREYILLLGDLIEDKKMVNIKKRKQTIMVGFLNENIEKNKNVYKENFDVILTDESATFDIVRGILLWE